MTALRLGSLFDGIGVFPLAAVRCGIEPVWASEIENAPMSGCGTSPGQQAFSMPTVRR